jgi:hypothetical protein
MNAWVRAFLHRRLPFAPRIVRFLRDLGPYAAIELLLPGGSLIVLVIWLYRQRRSLSVAGRALSARSDALIDSTRTPALVS